MTQSTEAAAPIVLPDHVSLEQRVAPETVCPNCGHTGMRVFYRVNGIPAHSVLLMETREQAVNYPRRDLELGFCPDCAFIGNVIFDPAVHEYSTRYEETQGFSQTFNSFARELARGMVTRYGLQDKSVLEIGCGKGEYLVMLVEEGAGRGIGIDPAYRDDRLKSPVLDRIEFIADFYSEKYTHLSADFVCCRHTLEHIDQTKAFMEMVRRSIGPRYETTVFFELPDVVRELRDGAFWDMYYEHCSYFCPGSLARVFRETGFDVERIWYEFGDQYLMLTAKPAEGRTEASLDEERDLEAMTAMVDAFTDVCGRSLSKWGELLRTRKAAGERIAPWGGGSKAVAFITTLGVEAEVDQVVDVNPHKHGRFLPGAGHEVIGPERLKEAPPQLVVVLFRVREIRALPVERVTHRCVEAAFAHRFIPSVFWRRVRCALRAPARSG